MQVFRAFFRGFYRICCSKTTIIIKDQYACLFGNDKRKAANLGLAARGREGLKKIDQLFFISFW
jgi:hypothetical protein